MRNGLPTGRAAGLLLAAGILAGVAASGQRPSNRADYRIEARYEAAEQRLAGELWLTWTNRSGESVPDLWFHLYWNAFSNNRSTHLQESDGALRGVEIEDEWGWIQVKAIEVSSAAGEWSDVFPTFQYRRPDDGREDDRTVFSVDLPRPVPDGASIQVHVQWDSKLPRIRRRTGYKDNFLLVAQWFPKLGVYEGGRGWNCHQFHANSEFYSDYGTYDVTLDLPPKYEGRVWGSGIKANDEQAGGRLKVTFAAPGSQVRGREDIPGREPLVHDFTWTADPDFVVKRRTFRFAEWADRFPDEIERVRAALGPDIDVTLRDVDVTVLVHPERERQVDRHFEATYAALFFYGLWYGDYPYQHITVVDPAWGASAAGGMEYPTLFTCGTRLFTTPDMHRPESVTVHECGHQFWYGLVGNNEFEAAWLDEGLDSYTDAEVLWRVFGARRSTTDFAHVPVDGVRVAPEPGGGAIADALAGRHLVLPLPLFPDIELEPVVESGFLDLWREQPRLSFMREWTDPRWGDRSAYLEDPDTDAIDTPAWLFADRRSYGVNSYARTAVTLRTLRGLVGADAFLRGMRHFATTWRYRHPYPADFYAAFQEGAGVDVEWYFRELFQSTGTGDWSVSVEQERRPAPRGFFQSEGGEFLERVEAEDAPESPWQIRIELRRSGELRLPIPLELTYEDGTVETLVWTREEQGERTWKELVVERESRLVSAVLDPGRAIWLDADHSNDRWFERSDRRAPWRWGERALSQYQRYFHWIAGLGG
jgi:hypothetical protein